MPLYPFGDDELQKVENNFTYHKPISNQPERYEQLREKAKELARMYLNLCPPSRERAVALTKLETSIMWANASIARNETESGEN